MICGTMRGRHKGGVGEKKLFFLLRASYNRLSGVGAYQDGQGRGGLTTLLWRFFPFTEFLLFPPFSHLLALLFLILFVSLWFQPPISSP